MKREGVRRTKRRIINKIELINLGYSRRYSSGFAGFSFIDSIALYIDNKPLIMKKTSIPNSAYIFNIF